MTADAATFIETAKHVDVAALADDPRAAMVLDRAGTRVLWANAAGLGCLGVKGPPPAGLTATGATARTLAALAGRLPGDAPRIERIPLPVGIVPVLATCAVRRITLGSERAVLVTVVDGTGALRSPAEAAARYADIVRSFVPEPPAAVAVAEVTEAAPPETPAGANRTAAPPPGEKAPPTGIEETVVNAPGPVEEPVIALRPAGEPAAAAGPDVPFLPAHGRTIRFVFELDPRTVFTFVSPEFTEAVGPGGADLVGRTWSSVVSGFGIDPLGRIAAALDRRDTFTGLTVDWPVDSSTLRVPVDLAGMPVFARDRAFQGYRGFGVAKCGAAFETATPTAPAGSPGPLTDEEIRAGSVIVEAEVDDAADIASGTDEAADVADQTLAADIGEAASDPGTVEPFDDLPPGAEAAWFEALETDGEADLDDLARLDESVATDDQPVIERYPGTGEEADDGTGEDEPAGFLEGPRADDTMVEDLGDDWTTAPEHDAPTPDYGLAEPEGVSEPEAPTPPDDGRPASETATYDVDPAAPDAAPEVSVETAEPVDVTWRTTARPTAEVIPSPIVPRPVPAGNEPEGSAKGRLSRPEREAFQKIAEALGARMEQPLADDAGVALLLPDAALPGGAPETGPGKPDRSPPLEASLLDRLPVAVAILKDGEALVVNRVFLDLVGYPDRDALVAAGGLAEAFAGSALPRDASLPAIRRRDGVEVPVHARLHSIPWAGGIASMLVVQETATATGRERAEAAEARVDELDAILDTATDGVLVLDGQGTVLGANRSAEALFGAHRSKMVGESVLSLLAPESHRAALDYLDGLTRNGVASVLNDGREVIGRVSQGGLVPLFMTVGRISPTKFCAVLRDITQWKRAEEELVNARRSAENASSQKSDFLARISHEIRTPLNAIIGFSEVMMEERFGPVGSDRYKEYLRDIHLSGEHIMSLVNDLLDLSKIEAGKLDLAFEAVAANEVIRECVALMQPQANRDRVIIRTSLSSSLPDVVADSRSLRQIVLNLLSNAIKFNAPGGQVIVSTIYEESGEVAIRVRDTGSGMSEDDIGKALEPFRQLHTTRSGRGTGLGLPLTKALVEANRAAFRIESAPGQGTLVQVTFPSTRVLAE